MYNFIPMTGKVARKISSWAYPEPYTLYNLDGSEECIADLMNGDYFYVEDDSYSQNSYFIHMSIIQHKALFHKLSYIMSYIIYDFLKSAVYKFVALRFVFVVTFVCITSHHRDLFN